MDESLTGKVALVTGGAKRVGAAICRRPRQAIGIELEPRWAEVYRGVVADALVLDTGIRTEDLAGSRRAAPVTRTGVRPRAGRPHVIASEAQQARQLSIVTGGTGGVYYPLGGGFANILGKSIPGVTATAGQGPASPSRWGFRHDRARAGADRR